MRLKLPALGMGNSLDRHLQRDRFQGANTALQHPGSLVAAGRWNHWAAKPRQGVAVQPVWLLAGPWHHPVPEQPASSQAMPERGPGVAQTADVTFSEQGWCFAIGAALLHILLSYYSNEKEQTGHRWEKVI